jgi:fructose-bisphosphate aldolase class II
MPLVSMRQLLDHAAENGYGLPAFNVNNMEQVWAIMEAASQLDAPVIMQASAGARKYAGEPFLRHQILAALEAYPNIPIVMHQDHGQSPAVCMGAIRSGFSSVMMDGSLEADGKSVAQLRIQRRSDPQGRRSSRTPSAFPSKPNSACSARSKP